MLLVAKRWVNGDYFRSQTSRPPSLLSHREKPSTSCRESGRAWSLDLKSTFVFLALDCPVTFAIITANASHPSLFSFERGIVTLSAPISAPVRSLFPARAAEPIAFSPLPTSLHSLWDSSSPYHWVHLSLLFGPRLHAVGAEPPRASALRPPFDALHSDNPLIAALELAPTFQLNLQAFISDADILQGVPSPCQLHLSIPTLLMSSLHVFTPGFVSGTSRIWLRTCKDPTALFSWSLLLGSVLEHCCIQLWAMWASGAGCVRPRLSL